MTADEQQRSAMAGLIDHHAISQTLFRFARGLDTKDFASYAATFAPDAVVHFPHTTVRGREEIERVVSGDLGRQAATQHVITNIQTDVRGDIATATSAFLAFHLLDADRPADHWDGGGWYESTLARSGEEWLIVEHRLHIMWRSGGGPARIGPVGPAA